VADIVLAEFAGRVWLVRGDEHFDDLLRNELPRSVSVVFLPCASHDEVLALWREHDTPERDDDAPWQLNPAIVRRIRGTPGAQSVLFAAWSAMPDAAAQVTIEDVATSLRGDLAARLMLRQFSPAAPPPGFTDLQRLRGTLLAAALAREISDRELRVRKLAVHRARRAVDQRDERPEAPAIVALRVHRRERRQPRRRRWR